MLKKSITRINSHIKTAQHGLSHSFEGSGEFANAFRHQTCVGEVFIHSEFELIHYGFYTSQKKN